MKYKIFFLAITLVLCIEKAYTQYCTQDKRYSESSFFESSQITIGSNVLYGIAKDFQGKPDSLLMDLYYPNLGVDMSPKRPFILLAHGGGFSSGDKQSGDIRDLCIQLALRGFVCASINYRIGHDFSEYGQYKARYRAIQDGNAAMRFIVNNAHLVRIDTSWLFVGGQSAGSLLALGMVYSDQSEQDSISLLYSTTAISSELGNLFTSGNSLTNTYTIKGISNHWGGIVDSEVDKNEMLPTIAFHGRLDTIVRIDADSGFAHYTLNGSGAIHDNLTANNVCSDLTVDTTGGHGIFRNASTIFRAQRTSCFFKGIFCENCSDFYTTDSIPANCSVTLGAGDFHFGSNVSVYPNPFESTFNIEGLDGWVDLKIYNVFGELVYTNETSNGQVHLDVMPGIYLIMIKPFGFDRFFTTRLIKI